MRSEIKKRFPKTLARLAASTGLSPAFERRPEPENVIIVSNPEVLGGEPVLEGTRIPARHIHNLVQRGVSFDDIRGDYGITDGQIQACITFAGLPKDMP